MGSAFGRIQIEMLEPILNRVISILKKHSKIPDIQVDGKSVTIKFTSPLSRAQDTEDLLAVQQAVQFVIETTGPENAMVAFKIKEFGRFAADKTGMDATLVNSETEAEEIIAEATAARQVDQEQEQPVE
jgi:hypothetical protein